MAGKIRISGTGCCLVDLIYNNIGFSAENVRRFFSQSRGDGGLSPGRLVFGEEFESFCGSRLETVLGIITGGREADKINTGGPSIVSLINLAQLVPSSRCTVSFYGCGGKDRYGDLLASSISKTPVVLKNYTLRDARTPSTVVLSDPDYNNGNGERLFINSIGAAWEFGPGDLDEDFYDSDIVVFGGTALVPVIHDNLTGILRKARNRKCRTIVNTVFDFRNEKLNPEKNWPLGDSDEAYGLIDLLITDREEAARLTGSADPAGALDFFMKKDVSSVIITDGTNDILSYSDGRFFGRKGTARMPVSDRIVSELKNRRSGDTTGCGDNFAGAVIASVVNQLYDGISHPDLEEACCRGVVSGGFTCFYMGGTYQQNNPGEKRAALEPYYESYRKQISG